MAFDVLEYRKKKEESSVSEKGDTNKQGFDVLAYRDRDIFGNYNALLNSYTSTYEGYQTRFGKDEYRADTEDYLSSITDARDRYTSLADSIRSGAESYGSQYDADAVADMLKNLDLIASDYEHMVSSATADRDLMSQFKGADDYRDFAIGWLQDVASFDEESIAARQARYDENEARIAELEKKSDDLGFWERLKAAASEIGIGKSEYADDIDAWHKEKTALEAENRLYDREQGKLDSYFVPRTEEFLANAAKRDYVNPTAEDLERYSMANGDTAALIAAGYYPAKGAWRDKEGNPVDIDFDAAEPMMADKLGYYLERVHGGVEDDVTSDYAMDFVTRHMLEGKGGSWEELKDSEIDIYYDLLAREGQEAAYQFLEDMRPALNKRSTQKMVEGVDESNNGFGYVANNIASVGANIIGGGIAFVDDAMHTLTGREINPYSKAHTLQNWAQAVRSDTASDIDAATGGANALGFSFGDAYQALMSGADSLAGAFTLGGTGYSVLMGMGAASSQAKDLYERGASMGQIAAGSLLAGAAEMVFEKVSIESLLKNTMSSSLRRTTILNILKQGGIEASEEFATEVANMLSDAIVMCNNTALESQIQQYMDEGMSRAAAEARAILGNLWEATAGGFISGGGMSIGGSVKSTIDQRSAERVEGAKISSAGAGNTLRALAYEMAGDGTRDTKQLKRIADSTTKKSSDQRLGRLSLATQEVVDKQNKADIKNAIISAGYSKAEAAEYADYLYGEREISKDKVAKMSSDEALKTAISELYKSGSVVNERTARLLAARMGIDLKNANVTRGKGKAGEIEVKRTVDVTDRVAKGKVAERLSTGDAVTIDKSNAIAKVETVDGERVVYYNTDKGVVPSTDIAYASVEDGILYESFDDLNPAIANAAIKNYDGKMDVSTYVDGMREGIVVYGANNFQAVGKDISIESSLASLNETDQAFALGLGRQHASILTNLAQEAVQKRMSGETTENTSRQYGDGKVRFENGAEATTKNQRRAVALARAMARAIGIDIVFYDDTKSDTEGGDERGRAANGYYSSADNSIHLDLQKAATDRKTIVFTLSHELVHFIKDWSPTKFKKFADFLMEKYAEHGVSTSTLLANKMAALGTTDADLAYEEMLADACERMLLDSNAAVKLAELRNMDKTLFAKIKEHLENLLRKIRSAYRDIEPNTAEGRALQNMEDVLSDLHALFEEAAVDAAKNYQAAAQANAAKAVFGESTVSEGKQDTSVKTQLKEASKIGNNTIAYNDKHNKVNAAVLKVGVDTMIEMAEVMIPYLEQDGILPTDIAGKTIFKNGSYGRTGENTTLCVRTLTYEDFKDRVADELGRPLTVAESLLVSQKIYDIATDPQCIYCYVAADRKAYDEYLGEYHKAMDKYIKAMRKGGDIDALYEEYLDGRKDTAAQQKRWAMWKSIANSGKEYISAKDLATRASREKVISAKGDLAAQVKDAQRYAQSASWAKTVFDYRAYKGDILKLTQSLVDTLNSEYGLRMYSFSDYTPAFIVENMQMLIDAAARGLKSLAYTKDTAYAKIFAPTGQAINVSCFAKYDPNTKSYVEDSRQGASWAETKQLREKFRNVGAVMVCTNDAMVEWAMKQDWVDVVIPYHIVKTGTTIANEYEWRNYTAESSDRVGNKTANIYPTEHNNDFSTYRALIDERGITPRFDRFYQRTLNGEFTEDQYMKLVNEVRLPASELSAVVPMFDLSAAKESFGIDENGDVIEGGFVDKGGYMGGWYRAGVDVNQEVLAVKKDIEDGKSSLDVDYGMNKQLKEKQSDKYGVKKQAKTATDSAYISAVESGDMETARAMIEKAAKAAGYTEVGYGAADLLSFRVKDLVLHGTKTDAEKDAANFAKYQIRAGLDEVVASLGANVEQEKVDKIADNIHKRLQAIRAEAKRRGTNEARTHNVAKKAVLEILRNDFGKQVLNDDAADDYAADVAGFSFEASDSYDNDEVAFCVNTDGMLVIDCAGSKLSGIRSKDLPNITTMEDKRILPTRLGVNRWTSEKVGYYAENNGYSGVVFKNVKSDSPWRSDVGTSYLVFNPSEHVVDTTIEYDENGNVVPLSKKFSTEPVNNEKSGEPSYAPTFYSKMAKAVDGIKGEKIGANSVVSYLVGKGIKKDEIKWSGIEAFLEGKKSVTKQELKDFVDASMLRVDESVMKERFSDYANNMIHTEKSFQEAAYSNAERLGKSKKSVRIVRDESQANAYIGNDSKPILTAEVRGANWGFYKLKGGNNYRELVFSMPNASYKNQAMTSHWGRAGVLAHARIQDLATKDGRKMLFVEEIQSDWHNSGHKHGYVGDEKNAEFDQRATKAKEKFNALQDELSLIREEQQEKHSKQLDKRANEIEKEMEAIYDEYGEFAVSDVDHAPDAPFRENYQEFVMKRLLRMAAEDGYDSIGWTTAKIQSDRWSDKYSEGYRIEYDQDIPSFMRKYGKKWGATVGQTKTKNGDVVWVTDITEAMKQSVLYEGQVMFQKKQVTDRELLADALESIAQNETERKIVEEYKSKLSELGELYEKKSALSKQLRNMYESKAEPRDAEWKARSRSLRDEIVKTENRIETYDRMLLKTEATKPFQKVIKSERLRAEKETSHRYQEMIGKNVSSRRDTAVRGEIKRIAGTLKSMLVNGTKEKNVKVGLQAAVAAALDTFDLSASDAAARKVSLTEKLKNTTDPEEIRKISSRLANIDSAAERVKALKEIYEALRQTDAEKGSTLYQDESEAIKSRLDAVSKKVGDTPLFGWGRNGFGGGMGNGIPYATQADVRAAVDQQTLISKLDQQTYGLADSTYALNNAITNGFYGVQKSIDSCCCTTQRAIDGVNYNIATQTSALQNTMCNNTRDIIDNQNCNARAILDALTAQRIADKDERIAEQNQKIFSLELAASQAAQNNYLINQIKPPCPVPAYITCNPYTAAYGFGLNAGCACAG